MKKFLGIVTLIMILWVSTATEIKFSPDHWDIKKWCIVATDIIIDTQDNEIAATDIVMETSLEFVDFIPSNMFPYFLPPKIQGNVIHLVGFSTDNTNRAIGSWSIWTLYLKQKDDQETDGSIKLYFIKKWSTTDSNLSIAWWVDVLDTVGSALYRFWDTWLCVHNSADAIKEWIANKNLRMLLAKIDRDQWIKKVVNRKSLLAFTWLIILITILFFYFKASKQWSKK